jgi:glycosyltransferase involved in cell wall biosynthesis
MRVLHDDQPSFFAASARQAKMKLPAKKIAVIASYSPSLVNFRLELLKRMVEAGHSVTAFAPEDDAAVRSTLKKIGIELIPIPMARAGVNPFEDVKTVSSLVREFRQLRPDLVIPYTMKPIIYGGIAARLAAVEKRCFLVTGLGHVFSDAAGASLRGRMIRALSVILYRRALSGAEVVFAYNEADVEDIRRYRMLESGREITLVPGSGVDLKHFDYTPLRNGKPVFLMIARLLRDKGVFDYVEAARLLRYRFPDAEFQLLGPFDPNPSAISRAEIDSWVAEGTIRYLGETRDVRPSIKDCSVFVLPSYYREGIPRSILEALSIGRPIVTTDLAGCRDTVEPGSNGFLVPPRDPKRLADAMSNFLVDPGLASTMSARSRMLAERKFDVHAVNRLLLERMQLV